MKLSESTKRTPPVAQLPGHKYQEPAPINACDFAIHWEQLPFPPPAVIPVNPPRGTPPDRAEMVCFMRSKQTSLDGFVQENKYYRTELLPELWNTSCQHMFLSPPRFSHSVVPGKLGSRQPTMGLTDRIQCPLATGKIIGLNESNVSEASAASERRIILH